MSRGNGKARSPRSWSGKRGWCLHHPTTTELGLSGQRCPLSQHTLSQPPSSPSPASKRRTGVQPGSSCCSVQKRRDLGKTNAVKYLLFLGAGCRAQAPTEAPNTRLGDFFCFPLVQIPVQLRGEDSQRCSQGPPSPHKQPCLLLEAYLGTAQPTAWLLRAFRASPSTFCSDFPRHCSSAEHRCPQLPTKFVRLFYQSSHLLLPDFI